MHPNSLFALYSNTKSFFWLDLVIIKKNTFRFLLSVSNYLLNALVLENGSLLVQQIQGRPKEAISSAGTVGERKGAELYDKTRHAARKNIPSHENIKF